MIMNISLKEKKRKPDYVNNIGKNEENRKKDMKN